MPCHAAWVLWFLGLPDQSLARIQQSLMRARDLSDPTGLAHAHCFASILHQLRREQRIAQEHAEACMVVSREHGLVMYTAMATVMRGWSLSDEQPQEEAVAQMREGLAALQATGTEFVCPHFLALLAEALGKARQHDEGLRILDDALSVIQHNGERYYQAELYRVRGELLLLKSKCLAIAPMRATGRLVIHQDPPVFEQAEACFDASIKIAQYQKAKSWELRAVMSMARLYQDRGKQAQARSLLTRIYNSFTEGFDTVEACEARALLDELT